MKKDNLIKFIDKFYLQGLIETVAINVIDNKMATKFESEDGVVKGSVSVNSPDLIDTTFGVYDAKLFRTLISIMDGDLNINVNNSSDMVIDNINFNDGSKNVKFIPCDLDIIPENRPFKSLPTEFSLTVPEITTDFINSFSKSSDKIFGNETFSIKYNSDTKIYEMVFGYSPNRDTTVIRFPIDGVIDENDIFDRVEFNISVVQEILNANKDMSVKKLVVHKAGLLIFTFGSDEFECKYYVQSLVN